MFGAVISSLVDLAGLSDIVKVVVGSSDASIQRLHSKGIIKHIDLMFLDHYKPAYKTDLKLCEELKLVTPGSVLAADNVIDPGNPPYLEYVRSSVAEKRKALETGVSETAPDARFKDRTAKQYASRIAQEKLGETKGNPNLVYESKLVHSFEPTGAPVSTTKQSINFSSVAYQRQGRRRDYTLRGRGALDGECNVTSLPLRGIMGGAYQNKVHIRTDGVMCNERAYSAYNSTQQEIPFCSVAACLAGWRCCLCILYSYCSFTSTKFSLSTL